jgi:L,D-transpeptidase YcbB
VYNRPSESIFGRNFRAASLGCIRVANIDQLAAWLLEGTLGWSANRISSLKDDGARFDVKLKKPVPLYFTYSAAWATSDGVIQFRRDIYERDRAGADASSY